MRTSLRSAAFAAALLVVGARVALAGSPVHAVTSIPPLAMIVSDIGGDRVLVHSILPPGADPHTFEPKPSDAAAVAEADVVVMLGSALDDWLGRVIDSSTRAIVVRLDAGPPDQAAHGDEHGEDGHDPHVWLDPAWVRDHAVAPIHRALATADTEGAPRYGVGARAEAERLTDLEMEIAKKLERAQTRSFLAWHPAWQHFAHRFGLQPIGGVGESEGREPSLKAMAGAVRAGRAAGVRAVLVEPQVDTREASVLADEIGVPLVTVDPLGDAWSLDRATYQTLMLYNATAFAKALAVVHEEKEDRRESISALPPSPASP